MTTIAAPRPYSRNWLADFDFSGPAPRYRQTGAEIALSPENLSEAPPWLAYFAAVHALAPRRAAFTIAFTPDRPRPWYLIWPVLKFAGARIVSSPETADVLFHFQDATRSTPVHFGIGDQVHINMACRSIAKSDVERAFSRAFGYDLALDPRIATGAAVEKSEINGAHSGRVIVCPQPKRPGFVYQRLIDNRIGADLVEDLRTVTVGGRPIVVFRKQRPIASRFANHNCRVLLDDPANVFSTEEMRDIAAFCAEMGMDWGGLDILRDASSGKLFIVDVNKTDMGPPIALPHGDKLRATRALAAAFKSFVERGGNAARAVGVKVPVLTHQRARAL